MADPFKGYQDQPFAPARRFYQVAPADGADLPNIPKGLICSAAGNLVMTGDDGTTVTVAVNANTVYPFSPQRIKATGHTAGTVVALL
jgi:hypothetical protein